MAGGALDTVHRLYLLAPLLLTFSAGGLLLLAFGTAVVLLRWLARGIEPPWAARDQGYTVDVAATGLQLPLNIAFVPNAGNSPDQNKPLKKQPWNPYCQFGGPNHRKYPK